MARLITRRARVCRSCADFGGVLSFVLLGSPSNGVSTARSHVSRFGSWRREATGCQRPARLRRGRGPRPQSESVVQQPFRRLTPCSWSGRPEGALFVCHFVRSGRCPGLAPPLAVARARVLSFARDVTEGVLERLARRDPLGGIEHERLVQQVGELHHLARL